MISGMILGTGTMEMLSITFILPLCECDLNLTSNDKGVLAAVSILGVICSSHLWGFLADTKGRRFVIHRTCFTAFAITVISSFVQHFYIFAGLRFLNGFLYDLDLYSKPRKM